MKIQHPMHRARANGRDARIGRPLARRATSGLCGTALMCLSLACGDAERDASVHPPPARSSMTEATAVAMFRVLRTPAAPRDEVPAEVRIRTRLARLVSEDEAGAFYLAYSQSHGICVIHRGTQGTSTACDSVANVRKTGAVTLVSPPENGSEGINLIAVIPDRYVTAHLAGEEIQGGDARTGVRRNFVRLRVRSGYTSLVLTTRSGEEATVDLKEVLELVRSAMATQPPSGAG